MKKLKLVSQFSQIECGICCCAMLLRYYGSYESLNVLRNNLGVGRDGLKLDILFNFLKNRGMTVKVFSGKTITNQLDLNRPVICFLKSSHYVVVKKKNDKYLLFDPASGKATVTLDDLNEKFGGFLLFAEPTDEFIPVKRRLETVWIQILDSLRNNKRLVFSTIVLMLASYAFVIGVPIFVQNLVDVITSSGQADAAISFIAPLIGCFIGYFSISLLRCVQSLRLNIALGWVIEAGTYNRLVHATYKYLETRSPGDLLYRLTVTGSVKELLATNVTSGIVGIGSVVFIMAYMIHQSLTLTIVSMTVVLLIVIVLAVFAPLLNNATRKELQKRTAAQSLQSEALYSMSSLKLTSGEDRNYNEWLAKYKEVLDKFKFRMVISSLYSTITDSINMFAPVAILITGFYIYANGGLTLGEVIAFQSISSIFFAQALGVFSLYTQWVTISSYIERIGDIWDADQDEMNENGMNRTLSGEIEIRNISFQYGSSSPAVLNQVSLSIAAETKTAIVGTSGSGKSTLGKAICNLCQPDSGEIFYDGMPSRLFSKKHLIEQFGVIPQDAVLFNKTIYDNITLGNTDFSIEDVIHACEQACVHEEINALPMKYDTVVSEMGANFSGGQRQRILLARILINKPKIIVLDEATSSLDTVSEKAVYQSLDELGCTQIIIAHRLSTICNADQIIVMKNGRVEESGTHKDLMESEGEYYRLYRASKESVV